MASTEHPTEAGCDGKNQMHLLNEQQLLSAGQANEAAGIGYTMHNGKAFSLRSGRIY